MNNKAKVEAVLFAVGNRISLDEIAKLTGLEQKKTLSLLRDIRSDYDKYDGAVMVVEEGAFWKLAVREPFLPVIQNLVSETELSKTVMETLAVIAWKAPVLQSEVIRIRTNKAYDHIKELEETGFIMSKKHGRSKLIKLTDKFFNYFDLRTKQDIQEKFGNIKEPVQVIDMPEQKIEVVEDRVKVVDLEDEKDVHP
jgi:segregation and condensation protein B